MCRIYRGGLVVERNGDLLPYIGAVLCVGYQNLLTEGNGRCVSRIVNECAYIRCVHEYRAVGITAVFLVVPGTEGDSEGGLVIVTRLNSLGTVSDAVYLS